MEKHLLSHQETTKIDKSVFFFFNVAIDVNHVHMHHVHNYVEHLFLEQHDRKQLVPTISDKLYIKNQYLPFLGYFSMVIYYTLCDTDHS